MVGRNRGNGGENMDIGKKPKMPRERLLRKPQIWGEDTECRKTDDYRLRSRGGRVACANGESWETYGNNSAGKN